MKKHLSIVGIVIGLSLILYGRAKQSDIRILGYIILAPSILGAIKTYTGLSLDSIDADHSPLTFGVPDSGASRPGRDARSGQQSEPPYGMLPGRFSPPQTGARRFGGLPTGASDVTPDVTFRPPGGFGGSK